MNNRPHVDQGYNIRSALNGGFPVHPPELPRPFRGHHLQGREQDDVVDLSMPSGETINQQNPATSTSMNYHQSLHSSLPRDTSNIHQHRDCIDPCSTRLPLSCYQCVSNLGSSTVLYPNQQQNMTSTVPDFFPQPQQHANGLLHDLSVPFHLHGCTTDPNLASHVFFDPRSGRNSRLDGDYHLPLDMIPDVPDTCFNYITDLLREDSVDESPSTLHDIMAFQNCYKSFSYALSQSNPGQDRIRRVDESNNNNNRWATINKHGVDGGCGCENSSSHGSNSGPTITLDDLVDSAAAVALRPPQNNTNNDLGGLQYSTLSQFPLLSRALFPPTSSTNSVYYTAADAGASMAEANNQVKFDWVHKASEFSLNSSGFAAPSQKFLRGGKTHQISVVEGGLNIPGLPDNPKGIRKLEEQAEGRSRRDKQIATDTRETYEQITEYEDKLFCPEGSDRPRRPPAICFQKLDPKEGEYAGKGKWKKGENPEQTSKRGKNINTDKTKRQRGVSSSTGRKMQNDYEVADLRDLLTRCAQAIARVDLAVAAELLEQIRQHSSPYGVSIQRIAHYFAIALEARLAGNCSSQTPPSVAEILKASRIYVAEVPFMIMSYYITNKTIGILSSSASRLHIIDFGIYLGLQWPCIINNLSRREVGGGPPRLKITGIDFPQSGFRPSQRLEETGRCLARYAERFNLPFEYNAVAKQWEEVKLEDLNIDHGNEMVVVNCLYRSQHLLDESVDENSPRNAFLNLVKDIKPEYFLHGVVNGLYGAPFFFTRFREALYHYTTLFDLFEATMPREAEERMLLESKVYGKEAFNVIACEGVERVERPETYKRWQVRSERIGFKQMVLDEELLRRSKGMVRKSFREEFVLDEDDKWAVQGWKGRILFAISCWKTE